MGAEPLSAADFSATLATEWLVVDADLTALVVTDQGAQRMKELAYGYGGAVHGRAGQGAIQFAREQNGRQARRVSVGGFLGLHGQHLSSEVWRKLRGSIDAELGSPRRRVRLLEQQIAGWREGKRRAVAADAGPG